MYDIMSDRKMRLFAVACFRHLKSRFPSPPEYDEFVEWAELYADGAASLVDHTTIGEEVTTYVEDYAPDWWTGLARLIAFAIYSPCDHFLGIRQATLQVLRYDQLPGEDRTGLEAEEFAYQAIVLRDLIGTTPFRPVPVDPHWLTWNDGMIPKIAQVIYDERQLPEGTLDNTRLAVLADALEEAGCTNADILDHCRQSGEHYRGCWVVDLMLGRD
jgi:hypothetical protein